MRFTISDYYPTEDGKLVAVEIAAGGSEEGVLRVIDASNGEAAFRLDRPHLGRIGQLG